MIKPKGLKQGDTIGIIAPSSPSEKEKIKRAHNIIESLGFKVKLGKSLYKEYGYLSGNDEIRAEDVNEMFKDQEVDCIICLRGGYGSPRILDLIDYQAIRRNPKIFVGYSDITALHIAFNQICKLVTYHGPMPASDMIDGFDTFTKDSFFNVIMEGKGSQRVENPLGYEMITVNKGVARGQIVGGNLSLIVATIGTPYEIDVREKILFIEEVGEEPYKIDRMFNQLRLSGKLEETEGIILGDFNNCKPKSSSESLTLEDVIRDQIKPAGKPTIYKLQSGHCSPMITLPFGVEVSLDAGKQDIVLLEKTVNE